ncbi:type IV secretion system DNA-binding domain-containing protein [bacterium]|nr:type IV secretion system DNA-binding domain-containing protein [bacterium]
MSKSCNLIVLIALIVFFSCSTVFAELVEQKSGLIEQKSIGERSTSKRNNNRSTEGPAAAINELNANMERKIELGENWLMEKVGNFSYKYANWLLVIFIAYVVIVIGWLYQLLSFKCSRPYLFIRAFAPFLVFYGVMQVASKKYKGCLAASPIETLELLSSNFLYWLKNFVAPFGKTSFTLARWMPLMMVIAIIIFFCGFTFWNEEKTKYWVKEKLIPKTGGLLGFLGLFALLDAIFRGIAVAGIGRYPRQFFRFNIMPHSAWIKTDLLFVIAAALYGTSVFIYRHKWPRLVRLAEDFFKIDEYQEKREEQDITKLDFRRVSYDAKQLVESIRKPFILKKKIEKPFLLGVDKNKKPITITEKDMTKHVHILGSTGAGKTSRIIMPLAHQILNYGNGLCFIDFKGDRQAIQFIAEMCKVVGKKFYYFSSNKLEKSCTWNPLQNGDPSNKGQRVLAALQIAHDGNARYYSDFQRANFAEICELLDSKRIKYTLTDIYNIVRMPKRFEKYINVAEVLKSKKEVRGLEAALQPMKYIKSISTTHPEIDLFEIMKAQDVVYFNLPGGESRENSSALGRLVYMELEHLSILRKPTDPVFYIIMDEFHNGACPSLTGLVERVRSANYSMILSNQSAAQLEKVEKGFGYTIRDNTLTKIIFRREDAKEAADIAESTGKEVVTRRDMLQFDDQGFDQEKTRLDGRRSMQGYIRQAEKTVITDDQLLALPEGFCMFHRSGYKPADVIGYADYMIQEKEKDRLESKPIDFVKKWDLGKTYLGKVMESVEKAEVGKTKEWEQRKKDAEEKRDTKKENLKTEDKETPKKESSNATANKATNSDSLKILISLYEQNNEKVSEDMLNNMSENDINMEMKRLKAELGI